MHHETNSQTLPRSIKAACRSTAGAVYVSARLGATWAESERLNASSHNGLEQIGWSIATTGTTVLAGSEDARGSTSHGGAVLVFGDPAVGLFVDSFESGDTAGWGGSTDDGCLYKEQSPKSSSSRLWVCRKPQGFSKGCVKAARPALHRPSESHPARSYGDDAERGTLAFKNPRIQKTPWVAPIRRHLSGRWSNERDSIAS